MTDSLSPASSIRPKTETILFCFILLIGFFFRFYRIEELPAGMHTDQGLMGQCALRILHEGWRPFPEALNYQVPEPLLFYQLAGWFGLVGSSYLTFHLFFILLGLASFPLIYWTFRQLVGPRVALLALFLLAVMRWHWIETRNGYPSLQVPFYLFGAMAFCLYGLRIKKNWPFYLSSLFVGVGLYTYQAFKVVPFLLLIYAAYELYTRRKETKVLRRRFLISLLLVLAIATPLLYYFWQNNTLGNRESDLFIGKKIVEAGSLKPLWDVVNGTVLMFNRAGDSNPRHNLPDHRMLDDVTGVLFLIGLALAWRWRKSPEGFYPLAGFFILSLTGLLSTDIAPSNRLVCLTPFVAYFAALGGMVLGTRCLESLKKKSGLAWVGLVTLLTALTAQNAYTYFVAQAENEQCQQAFGPEQTHIGRSIEILQNQFPGKYRFFISPLYFHNHTVDFLAYPAREEVKEFNSREWTKGEMPKEKISILFLESKKSGELDLLKEMFPRMSLVPFMDQKKQAFLFCGFFTPQLLEEAKPWNRGLKGVYVNSSDKNAKPIAVQWDPVLNFTGKRDFPFTTAPPFRIHWTSKLEIATAGNYEFQFLTTDRGKIWLDGRPVTLEKPLALIKGPRALRVDYEKDGGDSMAFSLIWKKPGQEKWEVVPATAFGKITP